MDKILHFEWHRRLRQLRYTVYEDLNKKLKDDFDCIRRRDGSVMIDAKTRRNAIEVEKLQKIQNKNVSTARDPRLNSIRGTILVPLSEFKNENLEERIQGHLQQQNIPVSNVTIFKKNSRKGNTLTCACITFESRSMPASVRMGFEKVKVKEDIPKPKQYHTCWKSGHAKKHCEDIPCCPIFGTLTHNLQHCPHHGDRSYKGHCPNCNEDGHTAFSKLCALYRREEEILLTMYRQGITKEKARKLLTDTGRYADIVYARRFAQGANSLVHSHQHHQQQ